MARNGTGGSEERVVITDDEQPIIIGADGSIRAEDDGDSIPVIEPESIRFDPDASEQPRRRGRKPGGRNRTSAKETKEVQGNLSELLYSLHLMGANLLKVPELELEEKEAEKLGKAVAKVQALFPDIPLLSEKQQAIANLVIVAGAIYAPRFIAHNVRVKKEKAGKPTTIDAPKPYTM